MDFLARTLWFNTSFEGASYMGSSSLQKSSYLESLILNDSLFRTLFFELSSYLESCILNRNSYLHSTILRYFLPQDPQRSSYLEPFIGNRDS